MHAAEQLKPDEPGPIAGFSPAYPRHKTSKLGVLKAFRLQAAW